MRGSKAVDKQTNKMNNDKRIVDYERFSLTLIILSVYFYLGGLIHTYFEPSSKGNLLLYLTFFSLLFVYYFITKRNRLIDDIDHNEYK